jgi:hypothetical protein
LERKFLKLLINKNGKWVTPNKIKDSVINQKKELQNDCERNLIAKRLSRRITDLDLK